MTITLNVLQLLLLVVAATGAGFFFRSKQLKKKQSRIYELENEMISNHAEILKLHEELSVAKKQQNPGVPVVPLKKESAETAQNIKKKA